MPHALMFSGIKIIFTSLQKTFRMLEYVRTQSNKTVQRSFEREFHKKAATTAQI